jgi:hypothetical protein
MKQTDTTITPRVMGSTSDARLSLRITDADWRALWSTNHPDGPCVAFITDLDSGQVYVAARACCGSWGCYCDAEVATVTPAERAEMEALLAAEQAD